MACGSIWSEPSECGSYPGGRPTRTIELIDAPPFAPLLITFAELDLLQMQVQAGELFARLSPSTASNLNCGSSAATIT